MKEAIGKVRAGDIKPPADYEIWEVERKTLLISRERFESGYKILGEVVDILPATSEKITEYRAQGYWPMELENSSRVVIVRSIPLYQAGDFRKNLPKIF